MASATFNDVILVKCWRQVATRGGTLQDVVKGVMDAAGGYDYNHKKTRDAFYNRIVQRRRNLTEKGVTFPPLSEGQRGRRKSVADISALNAILAENTEIEDSDQEVENSEMATV